MSSPCPSVAGSVKKMKVAGLLPRGECGVCTGEQDEKALYRRSFYLAHLSLARGYAPFLQLPQEHWTTRASC